MKPDLTLLVSEWIKWLGAFGIFSGAVVYLWMFRREQFKSVLRAIWTAFVVDIFAVGLIGSWVFFNVKVMGNDVVIGQANTAKR